jgi:hypothetical protein
LKISSAIDIRWPLPPGSNVDQIHAATFVVQHVPNGIGACTFWSRRGGIPEA